MENPALRAFLKLSPTAKGMVVHRPASDAADYPLREWDLITRIGTTAIDEDGMIRIGANLRVRFAYLVQKVAHEGKVPLTVVRAGKEVAVELPAVAERVQLLPELRGDYPPYFIFGPMVFSRATSSFVSGIAGGKVHIPFLYCYGASPLMLRLGDQPAFPGEELVTVCSPFFPHKLAKGYSNPVTSVVKSINGVAIKNLAHLVEVLRDNRDEFIVIESDQRGGEGLVFKHKAMLAATDEILSDNGVRAQGSPAMLAIWNAKPAP